jgi:hypothetical protein
LAFDPAQALVSFVQKEYSQVVVCGSKVLCRKGRVNYFIRAKDGRGKTIRFVSGDGYITPCVVTTSERKRLGRRGGAKKS